MECPRHKGLKALEGSKILAWIGLSIARNDRKAVFDVGTEVGSELPS